MTQTDAGDTTAAEPEPEPVGPSGAMAVATGSLGEYVHAWWARVRSGDPGILPVIVGLVLISIIFQTLNSNFLTAGNLINLGVQSAVFMLLAMGEVFVLLLGEIDLSAGYVAGICGTIAAELIKQ